MNDGFMATATLRPNGAGASTQLTPVGGAATNWQTVSDQNNATYVESNINSTTPQTDLYVLPSITGTSVSSVVLSAQLLDTGLAQYGGSAQIVILTHGTQYVYTFSPTESFAEYDQILTQNPYTGNAWTIAEINALQIGVILASGVRFNQRTQETTYYPVECSEVWATITYVTGILYTATATETLALSDTPTVNSIRAATLTDSKNISDSASTIAIRTVALASTIALTDSLVRLWKTIQTITESSLNITDLIAHFGNYVRTTTDSLSVTDTPATTSIRSRTTTDTLSVAETSLKALSLLARVLTDGLPLADIIAIGSQKAYTATPIDSLTISDATVIIHGTISNLTEILLLSDLIAISRGAQAMGDLVTIGDTILTQTTHNPKIVEPTLNLSDALTRFNLKYTGISDNVPLSDVTARTFYAFRQALETLPVTDIIGKGLSASALDALTLNDLILYSVASGTVLRILLNLERRNVSLFVETVKSDEYEH